MLYNLNKHRGYIGKTLKFHSRAEQHKNNLLCNTHSNKEMQKDFNNGDEFCFVILEDMGMACKREEMLLREKQYIYTFQDKHMNVYNLETMKRLETFVF